MILDNLIHHLEELKTITGGKVHVMIETKDEDIFRGTIQYHALTVLKTEEGISIRNF